MKLLTFDGFIAVLAWDDETCWSLTKAFRFLPGRTEAEEVSPTRLPFSARCVIAEICEEPLP